MQTRSKQLHHFKSTNVSKLLALFHAKTYLMSEVAGCFFLGFSKGK